MAMRTAGMMAQKRRQQLLERAAAEFGVAGYEQASLNKIISACRVSKSSFYHYFASKAELFDTVVSEAAAALGRELQVPDPQRLAGPGYWDTIERLFRQLLALSEREWYVDFGKLFYLADPPVEHSPALCQVTRSITTWFEQALAAGQACGAIRDDLPTSLQTELAIAILRAMDSWSLRHMHELDPARLQELAETQLDTLRRLLAP